ncbi:unnamed protein product [Paramecium pentaurelia]|uniref:Uncharacterized protein n=1 Tax=Paramecium pentaurelia TaxID=43138 RepID=A0A8S1WVI5_9CILI|nr:unnamed protein product [Paramecium pentaurelia]
MLFIRKLYHLPLLYNFWQYNPSSLNESRSYQFFFTEPNTEAQIQQPQFLGCEFTQSKFISIILKDCESKYQISCSETSLCKIISNQTRKINFFYLPNLFPL